MAWRHTKRVRRLGMRASLIGMHRTSMLKLQTLRDLYMTGEAGRVLEVGSAAYAGDATLRDLVPPQWKYTGLDVAPGRNVDLVPAHPYLWRELPDETFDLCDVADLRAQPSVLGLPC